MAKGFVFKFLIGFSAVVVSVLWILSIAMPETFGGFNLSWAIAIFSGICGITFLLKGFTGKDVIVKKFNILFGVGLILVCFVSIIGAINLPDDYILPIIAIIVTVGLLLAMVATGGKKWDQGDNQNAGYKNYYQRKKEEEKNK